MPDEYTNKAIEELAKQLPVRAAYEEVVSPSAKAVGGALSDVVKTLLLATVPFQLSGAAYDRLRSFIDRSIRAVPEGGRVKPPLQILGPVLEGIRYELPGSEIEALFSALLSCAMDTDRVGRAHPAFVKIVAQLAPDEARILRHLVDHSCECICIRTIDQDSNPPVIKPTVTFEKDELPRREMTFPEQLPLYLDHLRQMDLTQLIPLRPHQPLFRDATQSFQTGIRTFERLELTAWGRAFAAACAPSRGT